MTILVHSGSWAGRERSRRRDSAMRILLLLLVVVVVSVRLALSVCLSVSVGLSRSAICKICIQIAKCPNDTKLFPHFASSQDVFAPSYRRLLYLTDYKSYCSILYCLLHVLWIRIRLDPDYFCLLYLDPDTWVLKININYD